MVQTCEHLTRINLEVKPFSACFLRGFRVPRVEVGGLRGSLSVDPFALLSIPDLQDPSPLERMGQGRWVGCVERMSSRMISYGLEEESCFYSRNYGVFVSPPPVLIRGDTRRSGVRVMSARREHGMPRAVVSPHRSGLHGECSKWDGSTCLARCDWEAKKIPSLRFLFFPRGVYALLGPDTARAL